MSEGLVEVLILPNKIHQVDLDIINLIVEEIVEVRGVEHILTMNQILLDSCFEGADSLRLQCRIFKAERRPGKGFLKAGVFEASGVGKAQPRPRENVCAAQSLKSQCYARHTRVAESAVVDESSAGNGRQPAQRELLLRVHLVIQALAVGLAETDIADKSVFVFGAVTKCSVSPRSLRIVALIFKPHAVDAVDFMRRKIEDPVNIAVNIQLVIAIEVVESREVVLPSMGRGDSQFHTAQKIVVLRPLGRIGRLQLRAVEVPLPRNSRVAIRVSNPSSQ